MFANDHCTGKLNYVKLIRESIWFAMIDSRIDSVRNILIRCTPNLCQKTNEITKCVESEMSETSVNLSSPIVQIQTVA